MHSLPDKYMQTISETKGEKYHGMWGKCTMHMKERSRQMGVSKLVVGSLWHNWGEWIVDSQSILTCMKHNFSLPLEALVYCKPSSTLSQRIFWWLNAWMSVECFFGDFRNHIWTNVLLFSWLYNHVLLTWGVLHPLLVLSRENKRSAWYGYT